MVLRSKKKIKWSGIKQMRRSSRLRDEVITAGDEGEDLKIISFPV